MSYKKVAIQCFSLLSGQWRPGLYYRSSFDLVIEDDIYSTNTKPFFDIHTEVSGVYVT